jgi:hypothetical protein
MNYRGIIIEESLLDPSVLSEVEILETKVEGVTSTHKTPWLLQWTMHTVEFPAERADRIADEISKSIDSEHPSWYADFKNDTHHYIVYLMKVFKIDLTDPSQYKDAKKHGRKLGIPAEQLDFA